MPDLYTQIVNSPLGRPLKAVGLPQPVELERYQAGDPVIDGTVLLAAAPGTARLAGAAARVLSDAQAQVATALEDPARAAAADAGLDAAVWNADAPADETFKALVFDATGIGSVAQLSALHAFFSPTIRRVAASGRIVILGTPPQDCDSAEAIVAQRALEGFSRSVAKEVRRGATANLVLVAPGAEDRVASTLAFLLSPKSAYVNGQVVRIGGGPGPAALDWDAPLAGRVALVTGASRGIGAAIVQVLERDGAHVVGLDMPGTGAELELDITDAGAPEAIARRLADGLDVVVHNAGITRDKTLGRMDSERWDQVLDVNVGAPQRITARLLQDGLIGADGRVIGVSSISGIAGNAGQTNYATSKAAVIGLVQALAGELAQRGATINAVAPGFIETEMTAKMPLALREGGRRMNSLSQGGLPVDVAETVAWLAATASGGVNGNVVRVCGQSMIGA